MNELCIGAAKKSAEPIASHRRGPRNEKKRLTQIPIRDRGAMSRSADSLPSRYGLNIVANQMMGAREYEMAAEANFVKSLERSFVPTQYSEKPSVESTMSLPSVRSPELLHPWSKVISPDPQPEHHLTFLENHRDDSDAISELSGMVSTNSMLSQMSFISSGGHHHTRKPAKRKSQPRVQPKLNRREKLDTEEKERARTLKAYFDCISEIYGLQNLQYDVDHVGTIHRDLSTDEGNVKHSIKSRVLMKQLLSELHGMKVCF